jgi:hypothetical protein
MVPAMPALSHLTTSRQSPSVDSLQIETVVDTVGKSLVWGQLYTLLGELDQGRATWGQLGQGIFVNTVGDSLCKGQLVHTAGDSLGKGQLYTLLKTALSRPMDRFPQLLGTPGSRNSYTVHNVMAGPTEYTQSINGHFLAYFPS